jgi:hypothetical protein
MFGMYGSQYRYSESSDKLNHAFAVSGTALKPSDLWPLAGSPAVIREIRESSVKWTVAVQDGRQV